MPLVIVQLVRLRECFNCGSTKTYVQSGGHERWLVNHDADSNVLCNPCYHHLIAQGGHRTSNRKHEDGKTYGFHNYWQAKNLLFDILGRECVGDLEGKGRCGFSDVRILQFDHIEGNGLAEVKRFGSNFHVYRYYVRHPDEARIKLQVLCPNCNALRKILKKQFPSRKRASKNNNRN